MWTKVRRAIKLHAYGICAVKIAVCGYAISNTQSDVFHLKLGVLCSVDDANLCMRKLFYLCEDKTINIIRSSVGKKLNLFFEKDCKQLRKHCKE